MPSETTEGIAVAKRDSKQLNGIPPSRVVRGLLIESERRSERLRALLDLAELTEEVSEQTGRPATENRDTPTASNGGRS